jgi:sphingolipid delta-4 desaturase
MPSSAGAPADASAAPRGDAERISPQARRHNDMRRQALRRNPALRGLSGPFACTALALPLLIGLHWGIAWLVSGAPVWAIFLAAFVPGQLLIHGMGALLHETAHRLIFRRDLPKLCFDLLLEAGMTTYGRQLTYQHEHITSHHPYIGNYERDYEHEDICAIQARRLLIAANPRLQRFATLLTLFIHALPLGPVIGDLILPRINARLSGFPVKDPRRDVRATRPPRWQVWLFVGTSLASNAVMLGLFGPWALLYQVWSVSLFVGKLGVWNLGQSLSEHAGDDAVNPTQSHYGWINLLLFNTGYHNEHHTFPTVAWNRLPAVKQGAPDLFRHEAPKGYAAHWWDHVRQDFRTSRRNAQQDADNADRCGGAEPTA